MTTAVVPETLILQNLSTGYRGRPVINNLTLAPIAPGHITALVGPNAAGKSTLLRAMAGLLPAKGSLHLGATDLLALSLAERAKHVTFMPQTLPQGVSLSVLETVISAIKASPLATQDARHDHEHALETLQRIGIADIALEPLDQLSGGQRQLVSLAQSIARQPRVLLLDEPTSALDLRHQVTVMHLANELANDGRIVVVVLHDLNLAARWARHIIVLDHGTVYTEGSPGTTLTTSMLAHVYGVSARIEPCSHDRLNVIVDGPVAPAT